MGREGTNPLAPTSSGATVPDLSPLTLLIIDSAMILAMILAVICGIIAESNRTRLR